MPHILCKMISECTLCKWHIQKVEVQIVALLLMRWAHKQIICYCFFRPSNKLICSHIHDLIFTCLFLLGCEQVLTVANGSISSPAFGLAPYPSNQECTYLVKRPKGGPLSLRFTHFDLDDGDFVQVSFLHLHS